MVATRDVEHFGARHLPLVGDGSQAPASQAQPARQCVQWPYCSTARPPLAPARRARHRPSWGPQGRPTRCGSALGLVQRLRPPLVSYTASHSPRTAVRVARCATHYRSKMPIGPGRSPQRTTQHSIGRRMLNGHACCPSRVDNIPACRHSSLQPRPPSSVSSLSSPSTRQPARSTPPRAPSSQRSQTRSLRPTSTPPRTRPSCTPPRHRGRGRHPGTVPAGGTQQQRPAWAEIGAAAPRRILSPAAGTVQIDIADQHCADRHSVDRLQPVTSVCHQQPRRGASASTPERTGARQCSPAQRRSSSPSRCSSPLTLQPARPTPRRARGVPAQQSPSYASPTLSSTRKAPATLPTSIRVEGLTGRLSPVVGDYVCTKAPPAPGFSPARSSGPCVVYSKVDPVWRSRGCSTFKLVYQKGEWRVISSTPVAGSVLAFVRAEREGTRRPPNPCLIPAPRWQISDGERPKCHWPIVFAVYQRLQALWIPSGAPFHRCALAGDRGWGAPGPHFRVAEAPCTSPCASPCLSPGGM
jgi:hypothetical protein